MRHLWVSADEIAGILDGAEWEEESSIGYMIRKGIGFPKKNGMSSIVFNIGTIRSSPGAQADLL